MKPTQIILSAIPIIGIVFIVWSVTQYETNGEIINSGYVPAEITNNK